MRVPGSGNQVPGRAVKPTMVITVAMFLSAVFAACGVPTNRSPQLIARKDVPFHLLAPSLPTTTTTTTEPAAVSVPVHIYLIGAADHLTPVARDIPLPAADPAVLAALVDGPTGAEASAGLQTDVPATTKVLSVSTSSATQVATVDFSSDFGQVVGPEQILPVAQVVFTMTSLPGITSVLFQLEGQAIDVPTGSGAQVPGPVSRAQFGPQAPVVPTPSPPSSTT